MIKDVDREEIGCDAFLHFAFSPCRTITILPWYPRISSSSVSASGHLANIKNIS